MTNTNLFLREQAFRLSVTDWVGDELVERVRKALRYLIQRRQQSNHHTTASDFSEIQAQRATESIAVLVAF